jgi:hypothetical protein
VLLLPIGGAPDWGEYAAAFGLMTVTFSVMVLAPWSALPASARLVLPVAFLGAVTIAGVGAFFAVPVVLVGGPDYPASASAGRLGPSRGAD